MPSTRLEPQKFFIVFDHDFLQFYAIAPMNRPDEFVLAIVAFD